MNRLMNTIRRALGREHTPVPVSSEAEREAALKRLTEQRLRLLRVDADVSVRVRVDVSGKTPGGTTT